MFYRGWQVVKQGGWWTAVKVDRPESLRALTWRELKQMLDGKQEGEES